MGTMLLVTPVRNAMAQIILNAVDAGVTPGGGKLFFYTAPMPASASTEITTQILLGETTFSDPAGAVAAGSLVFDTIIKDWVANADGAAAFVEVVDSDGARVGYLDVSDADGNGAIRLGNVNIVAGGTIEVLSLVITIGGG